MYSGVHQKIYLAVVTVANTADQEFELLFIRGWSHVNVWNNARANCSDVVSREDIDLLSSIRDVDSQAVSFA